MRILFVLAIITALIACLLNAEDLLDVAAIKPHPDGAPCGETRVLRSGQLEAACFTLEVMIREGLNILPKQLSGGPEWIRRDRWDISAKATSAAGKPEEEIYKQLLLAVSFQRFSLKLREERRPADGFALTVSHPGKWGPGLTKNSGEPHSLDVKPGPLLIAHGISMSELAEWLRWPAGAGRLVVDKTALSGLYDITLKWTPLQNSQITHQDADADEPVIFTALKEQLGLKLVSTKVEQKSYEIEGAERPNSN